MGLSLTARARILSQRRNVQPNLILEIDGVPTIYSTVDVLKIPRIGYDGIYIGMPYLVIGGQIIEPNSESLISMTGGGSTITQQLLQDKGAASSVSTLSLELIDQDGEISNLITPGNVVTDLLTTKAKVYMNFAGGNHPDDSVLIHRGIIDAIEPMSASVKLTISHPEQQKRQELFVKQNTKLNGAINNSQTTITVDSTANFILPSGTVIESYIKINDEIIKFTGSSATQFTGCTRGALGSIAASHADNDEVESYYRLQDNAVHLALKLMLSGGDAYFVENLDILHLGARSPTDLDSNTIFFNIYDVQEKYGLVVGDYVTITGSGTGGNNHTLATITGFGTTDLGSYVEINNTFTLELNSPAVANFKSKYNVLTTGMSMTPEDVDVAKHEEIYTRFSSTIPAYDFYIKDTITGKDFLSKEVYYPAGLYTLPRKAKASVGITIPPIADDEVKEFNSDNVINPASIKTQRSITKNFYNSIVVKYDELSLEDKFVTGKVTYSANSQNRLKNVGNKPMTIVSKGLRDSPDTDTLLRINSRRWLERYEFASEHIPGVKVFFKDGFSVDVGDIVVFGDTLLGIVDLNTGDRQTQPKLYEVVNKSMNLKSGEVSVDLLSTNFNIDGRYGVVSPSTLVGVGSTTTRIVIKDSYSTTAPSIEKDKWGAYIGEKILVHSSDYSFSETVTLVEFDPADDYAMTVTPALSAPPSDNYVIDVAFYPDNTNALDQIKLKTLHCFFDPQVTITSGTSNTVFDVGAGDISKFKVGAFLRVHTSTFSVDSPEVQVSNITGTTITVDASLGFTPSAGYLIDLIGFKDEGKPYRLI